MYIPLCKREMSSLCEFVINKVIENVREEFNKEGFNEAILQQFKSLWKDKLTETNAVDEVEIENKPEPVLKEVIKEKTVVQSTQKYAVGSQIRQVTGKLVPIPSQVFRQNISNGIAVQNQNVALPRYINKTESSRSFNKMPPTNQVNPNSNVINWLQANPQAVVYTIPTPVKPVQVQINNKNSKFVVRNTGLSNVQQYQIVNQDRGQGASSVNMSRIPTTSQINNQPQMGNYHQIQNPNRYVRVQSSAPYSVPRTINRGQQNVTFSQFSSNAHLASAANAQVSNFAPGGRVPTGMKQGHHNPSYNNYGQQFLTRPAMPVTTSTVVFPHQMQQNATDVRSIQSHNNMFPISTATATNQGNLNQITQPVVRDNSISFDDIIQLDGACDSSSDEKEDVEFMSNSDSDDGGDDGEQGNVIQNLKRKFDETGDVEFMSSSDNDDSNEEQENDLESHEFNDIGEKEKTDYNLDNDDVQKETIEDNSDDDSEENIVDDNDDDSKKEIEKSYELLNSDDDISIESNTALFDTENIVICKYEKVKKQQNLRWRISLTDGFMYLNGKEYVFKSADVQAFFFGYVWNK